jgi:RimJ/RimL family protein N-acetyltransferase
MNQPSVIFSHASLYLRKITPEDTDFLLKLNSRPEVMKYTGEEPWTSWHQAEVFIHENRILSQKGVERWLVCEPDGTSVGMAGYRLFEDMPDQWDISFRFLPEYWNQGYAYITVQLLTHHALNVIMRPRLRAQVHEENTASARVLEKCGYYLDHFFDWGEMKWRCYYIRPEDFLALPEFQAVR